MKKWRGNSVLGFYRDKGSDKLPEEIQGLRAPNKMASRGISRY